MVQRRVDCSDVLQCSRRRVAHGWVETVEAGAKQISELRALAGVKRRLSSAPPISMNVLSTQDRLLPIRLHAHSPSRSSCTLHGQSHDQIPIDFRSRRSMHELFKRGLDEREDKTT